MRYIVLALLFVVVIGAAGFFALSQKRGPHDSDLQKPAMSQTTPNTPTDTPIQTVTDSSNLLTFTLPANWTILKEGSQGIRLSGIQAESPDFSMRSDETAEGPFTPIYYDSGAHIQVSIQTGTRPETDRPAGEILEEKTVIVDDREADYFRYKEPSTLQGELLDVRFTDNEISYYFRYAYNPDTLSTGEHDFFTIIDSVELTE